MICCFSLLSIFPSTSLLCHIDSTRPSLTVSWLYRNLQRAIDLSAVVVDPETELQDILIQPDYDPLESEAGAPEAMWMDDYLERMRQAVMESYRRGSLTGFQVPGVTL
jgi:hypothetical protein